MYLYEDWFGLSSRSELEDKPAANHEPLPPGLIRLAAVLAEIALNGTDSSLDLESPPQEKVDRLDENPLRGQTE